MRVTASPALTTVGAVAVAWTARHATARPVRTWSPGAGHRCRAGPLSVRTLGGGDMAVVLLHGLAGTGDCFGAGYDRLSDDARLVVPDLLGFGRSSDQQRTDFSLEAHLVALDDMVAELGLDDAPLRVGGHSMGGALALHWAARRARQVDRVVSWCAPLYSGPREGRAHVASMDWMERLFALEGPVGRRTCGWTCLTRPWATSWLSAAINPRLPVRLARQSVLHTWESYLGGMNGIILHGDWRPALDTLEANGVTVILAGGSLDPVPVAGLGSELAATYRCSCWQPIPVGGTGCP